MLAERTPLPTVGVIMLNTAFPRPVGDIGNPASFAGNVVYEFVEAATISRVMTAAGTEADLAQDFVAARDRLVARGAGLVTTSCGVLVFYQDLLQAGCTVPVAASSLFQVGRRLGELAGGRRVGVICMDSRSLSPAHLAAAGCPADMPVIGLEDGDEIYRVLKANDPTVPLDPASAEMDVVRAGRQLLARHHDIGAIVLECTNLPPYRGALECDLGLPVYDILTWIDETWREVEMASAAASRTTQ